MFDPTFHGAILSLEWKEAAWVKFVTGAPRLRTLSEQQYSDCEVIVSGSNETDECAWP